MPSAGLEPPLDLLLGRPGGKEMEMAPGRHVAGMHMPFLLDTECLALHCANMANAIGRCSQLAWPAEENVPFQAVPCPGPSGQTVSRTSGRGTMAPGLAPKHGETTTKVCFGASTGGLGQLVWCQCKPVSPGLTEK